jgi:hypothetical protein
MFSDDLTDLDVMALSWSVRSGAFMPAGKK